MLAAVAEGFTRGFKAEKNDFRKGMVLGADDYITKPFDDTELLEAIEVRLKKSEFLKKEFQATGEGLNEFLTDARGLEELKKMCEWGLEHHYSHIVFG